MTSSVQPLAPAEPRAAGARPTPAPVELTPREQVALITVAVGLTQGAAARRLGTSERSIRRALVSAVERLGARSQAHAVAVAALMGQLDLRVVGRGELPEWPLDPPKQTGAQIRANCVLAAERAARVAPRRARVMALLGEGLSPKEVAARLGLSRRMVYADRAAVRERSGSG
ncbi:hypothetical protein GCM10022254_09270 [Actinomadura meridiana]|uniref:HTH luxR-type domain-containing protein n=1 Tax=Actinomadura meridiana TaxID=559626 RepID=A0ABP8BTM8_9ACTN